MTDLQLLILTNEGKYVVQTLYFLSLIFMKEFTDLIACPQTNVVKAYVILLLNIELAFSWLMRIRH